MNTYKIIMTCFLYAKQPIIQYNLAFRVQNIKYDHAFRQVDKSNVESLRKPVAFRKVYPHLNTHMI